MSVIMRDSQTNKLILWCKGADSVIYSKLRKEFIDGDGPEKVRNIQNIQCVARNMYTEK